MKNSLRLDNDSSIELNKLSKNQNLLLTIFGAKVDIALGNLNQILQNMHVSFLCGQVDWRYVVLHLTIGHTEKSAEENVKNLNFG